MTSEEVRQASDAAMLTAGRIMALMMDDNNEEAFTIVWAITDPLERTFVTLYAAGLAGAFVMLDAEDCGANRDEHLQYMLDCLRGSLRGPG